MNTNHAKLCPSPEWAEWLQNELLPTLCEGIELGPRLLELGPGPGAATDWLRHRAETITSVEIEPAAADKLRERFAGTNVEIVTGDAAALPWPDGSFDAVATCTMLHHVPTLRLQNRVLAEALRVLRPGGWLLASDSLPTTELHAFHVDDTYVPIDPATLIARLQTIGFGALEVHVTYGWWARAQKPAD